MQILWKWEPICWRCDHPEGQTGPGAIGQPPPKKQEKLTQSVNAQQEEVNLVKKAVLSKNTDYPSKRDENTAEYIQNISLYPAV